MKVLDASGNVIAEKEIQLTTVDSYQKITLDLSTIYAVPCASAANIQIGFLSSGYDGVESQNNSDWLSRPAFGNLSDGRFTGSSLYIDDIKLNF